MKAFSTRAPIGATLVTILLLVCSTAVAQEDEAGLDDFGLDDELALLEDDGMVELAARHKQEIGMSPSAITVISREDIEASGATNIPDLLRLVPGMDIITSSAYYGAVSSRLYWSVENHHYLVLIDGREANNEIMGLTAWEVQPIFLEEIERIEIIRGPGSSLYGANALAGVISITTRAMPKETSGWARLSGGELGYMEAGARLSTRVGNWGFSGSGGGKLSSSYSSRELDGMQAWRARGVVEYAFSDKRRLLLDAGFTEGTGGVTTALGLIWFTMGARSLRLAYESEELRGQLYWNQAVLNGEIGSDLIYQGIHLASFYPMDAAAHTIDGELQWTIPSFYKPLMIIVGGGGRASFAGSDYFLDGNKFADPTSDGFHEPGISHWEYRAGAFVHAEYSPTDWVTLTGGTRVDYNSMTPNDYGIFPSPRLATVFKPDDGQFIRLGVARAFRKPSFQENSAHMMVEFPSDSPIQGPAQNDFLEFMARIVGNPDLDNEKLWSFEAGYLGQFFDDSLSVALDLYYNIHTDLIEFDANIVNNEGLPDLNLSEAGFMEVGRNLDILGAELVIKYSPVKNLLLTAAWSHREVLGEDLNPTDVYLFGGRYKSSFGLICSLYVSGRSGFWDRAVDNPDGMFKESAEKYLGASAILLGKAGYRWGSEAGYQGEAGVKFLIPFSLSDDGYPVYGRGGGVTNDGVFYGGDAQPRLISFYVQGSF
jgi:iron complex outermembrane recepter protein